MLGSYTTETPDQTTVSGLRANILMGFLHFGKELCNSGIQSNVLGILSQITALSMKKTIMGSKHCNSTKMSGKTISNESLFVYGDSVCAKAGHNQDATQFLELLCLLLYLDMGAKYGPIAETESLGGKGGRWS